MLIRRRCDFCYVCRHDAVCRVRRAPRGRVDRATSATRTVDLRERAYAPRRGASSPAARSDGPCGLRPALAAFLGSHLIPGLLPAGDVDALSTDLCAPAWCQTAIAQCDQQRRAPLIGRPGLRHLVGCQCRDRLGELTPSAGDGGSANRKRSVLARPLRSRRPSSLLIVRVDRDIRSPPPTTRRPQAKNAYASVEYAPATRLVYSYRRVAMLERYLYFRRGGIDPDRLRAPRAGGFVFCPTCF